MTYMKTVASFPRTIFFLSVGVVVICGVLLSLVHLENVTPLDQEVDGRDEEDLVADEGEVTGSGRNTVGTEGIIE